MSLCISDGHVEAFLYPLGLVMDEANFIRERENTRIITEAQLVQMAAGSIMGKKAGTQFSKMVKTLNVEAKPIPGRFD